MGIASIKRMQDLYQGTLVAQEAFSLFKTETLKEVKGWPDGIGEISFLPRVTIIINEGRTTAIVAITEPKMP